MTNKIILAIVFLGNTLLFGQTDGTIKGKISDKDKLSPVPFAGIVLKKNGQVVSRTVTDVDGNYAFCRLSPGVYTLKTGPVGYFGYTVLNLRVDSFSVDQNMDIEPNFIPGEVTVTEKPEPEGEVVDLAADEYVAEVLVNPVLPANIMVPGNSSPENPADATRVSEFANTAITIYPNPISESASIEITSDVEIVTGVVRVFDLAGVEVRTLSFSGNKMVFERQGLAAGVYMYHITSQDRSVATGKMVIM